MGISDTGDVDALPVARRPWQTLGSCVRFVRSAFPVFDWRVVIEPGVVREERSPAPLRWFSRPIGDFILIADSSVFMIDGGPSRRRLLGGVGTGTMGLFAGCFGSDNDGQRGPNGGDTDGGDETGDDGETDDSIGDGPITIATDYHSDPWEQYWATLTAEFEAETGVAVDRETVGVQRTDDPRLEALLEDGEPPELYHGTAAEVGDLINTGRTRPVDGVVDELEAQWGDLLLEDAIAPIGDERRLVPHGVEAGGILNYRLDVYRELGLEVPETWDELVENAHAIDEANISVHGGKIRGWALPAMPTGKAAADFVNWLYNAGGAVWMPGTDDDPELWLDEDHVTAVFDLLQELAQYSPDPSTMDWAKTIRLWTQGRIGQCLMTNAWLCAPAVRAGRTELALETAQALVPKRAGADPLQRGWARVDGTPIIRGSSHPKAAEEFCRFMYGAEHGVASSLVEPMRFLPAYEGILESPAYRSAGIFQMEGGVFLEKNRYCIEKILPELTSEETVTTPETLHADSAVIPAEMTNRLIVGGADPNDVYEWGYQEYESTLETARNRRSY